GMLHGAVLRSPYAHARVHRLDVSRAKALEGVIAVITAADVPGQKNEKRQYSPSTPNLVRDRAFFAGQPVAAVAAINPHIAEEALGLIEVDYEELPPLLDALEAMKTDATPIHPGLYTNVTDTSRKDQVMSPSNIAWHLTWGRGDVAAGFKEADIVLENTFRTQTVHQGYLEPRAAVASVDLKGKVTIWTDNQGIFSARELCARFLDLPLTRVKVMPVEVGGAFGGKSGQQLSPICALLALKTGRPVKMVMPRKDVFTATVPAPATSITIKAGVTREGRLTAVSATLVYDNGAFPSEQPKPFMGGTAFNPYRIPHLKVEGYDVVTNKAPSGSYRAPSAPQAAFAMESQMDLLARALGMDPLELRLRNVAVEGDPMPHGAPFAKIGFRETLEKMRQYLALRGSLKGENQGRGVACGYWGGGGGTFVANVNLNADGSVVLVVGNTDLTGCRTSFAQMVAEEFGIPFEKVIVVAGDTDTVPFADNSTGSRQTRQMGTAVSRACADAKEQLMRQAAAQLGAEPPDLEFAGGGIRIKNMPEKFVSLDDLARQSLSSAGDGPITGRGAVTRTRPGNAFAVQAAEVEVDKETGKVKVISYVAAQDVGLAINPTLVEGQIQGAVAQGIGWALTEDYIFRDGTMQNANLLDYRLPTAADLPSIETVLVEVTSDTGPYGLRPVGEPPIVPSLAAVANAIHSAAGVRLKELPMTPEAILRALQAQEK
ncbi:MAG: xanthine dehydrogenase family protein molybdopterin-binding subunit, partial [Dehalococcoidales bacterium]|nr:xanthine dehydrogenase family protein molybdopterin-binding subunit [Dehalococcoidales bacterium]